MNDSTLFLNLSETWARLNVYASELRARGYRVQLSGGVGGQRFPSAAELKLEPKARLEIVNALPPAGNATGDDRVRRHMRDHGTSFPEAVYAVAKESGFL